MVGVAEIPLFGHSASEVFAFRPDAAKIEAGSPDQKAWAYFTDPSGRFSAGIWEGQPGRWRVRYTEAEFCHLLSGVVELRDETGCARRFKAGDSFVIPAGFAGTWEVVEPARKLYATFEDTAAPGTSPS